LAREKHLKTREITAPGDVRLDSRAGIALANETYRGAAMMTSAKWAMVIVGLVTCGCLGKVSEPSGDGTGGGGGGTGSSTPPDKQPPQDNPPTPVVFEDADPPVSFAPDASPALEDAGPSNVDGGCISDSGTRCNRAPGEACMNNGECASGACFVGDDGTTFCSVECTADNAATVCTFGSQTCNQRGFCNN
jgi:hypothetical protein